MDPENSEPLSEREQTDESLRVEREKADHALEEQLSAIDETADAVVNLARERADEVVAAARAKIDAESSALGPAGRIGRKAIEKERTLEDHVLKEERADADETLRNERAEKVSLLATERQETDKDLSSERAGADDALATRDEFLGVVSHDLRTMLNAILGFAALIEAGVATGNHEEAVAGHARRIQRSGARMNRLIGDLVDVASIEAGKLTVTREVADPVQVVTEATDTFHAQALKAGISLVTEIVPPLSHASFDAARILQVLSNLLSNALKFTQADGKVVVRLEQKADSLQFAVADTGAGIPADLLEAVFTRFHQVTPNDRRGLGLGLYISKCIVQGHGGQIWAESRVGKGSTFVFTLPVLGAP
jgi:signal transduction histidine kinase